MTLLETFDSSYKLGKAAALGLSFLVTPGFDAGVNDDSALALALSQRFIWLLASLPGAAIHLLGAHLPKDFSVDYKEPVA